MLFLEQTERREEQRNMSSTSFCVRSLTPILELYRPCLPKFSPELTLLTRSYLLKPHPFIIRLLSQQTPAPQDDERARDSNTPALEIHHPVCRSLLSVAPHLTEHENNMAFWFAAFHHLKLSCSSPSHLPSFLDLKAEHADRGKEKREEER